MGCYIDNTSISSVCKNVSKMYLYLYPLDPILYYLISILSLLLVDRSYYFHQNWYASWILHCNCQGSLYFSPPRIEHYWASPLAYLYIDYPCYGL